MRIPTNQAYVLYMIIRTASCLHNIILIIPWRTKTDKHVAGQIFDSRLLQQPICSLKQPQGWKVLATLRLEAHLEINHVTAVPPIAVPLPVVGVTTGLGRRLRVRPLRGWFRDALLDVVLLVLSILEIGYCNSLLSKICPATCLSAFIRHCIILFYYVSS